MPDIELIKKAISLSEYRIGSITGYNRLEPNPRSADFDRSLKAEVRDALWMLTRQWQFGEFQGEDAASPFTARILGEHTKMDCISFQKDKVFPYDESIPLETEVEREKLSASLFLAVQMGRYFLKLMQKKALESLLNNFLEKYELNYTINPNDREGIQLFNAVKGKIFDGFLLYTDITSIDQTSTKFEDWIKTDIADGHQNDLMEIAENFKNWYQRNYSQPEDTGGSSWQADQLDYQFSIGASGQQQKTLSANQYFQGHADWHSLDLNSGLPLSLNTDPSPASVIENYVSFIPTPVSFKGMPNPRFWTMEESETDFGKIDTSTTGLLHLLLAEFGLIYSNDWFMLPYPLSINNLCEIKSLVITDVFGQHVLIRSAGTSSQSQWQRWAMFHQSNSDNTASNTNLFYLAPSITKSLKSDPLEKVNFLRDEMANMVWAVESIVPSQTGKGVDGNAMALKPNVTEQPAISDTALRYVLGTTVPHNWIPFIPVHLTGSNSEIHLQRAQMPGAKGAAGILLNEEQPVYFIREEEIPRSGIIVERTYQRTRWLNGKTYLWIGRSKKAGKGEGWSNLRFDQVEASANSND